MRAYCNQVNQIRDGTCIPPIRLCLIFLSTSRTRSNFGFFKLSFDSSIDGCNKVKLKLLHPGGRRHRRARSCPTVKIPISVWLLLLLIQESDAERAYITTTKARTGKTHLQFRNRGALLSTREEQIWHNHDRVPRQ
ncbi:hypothetical protein K439DRAFT_474628 [Ramaria rubella]|nr:hypothetical protein K439DRAFT_474628 [Ramaria rubella]